MKTRAKWLVGCVAAMGVCGLMAEDWYTLSDGVLSFDVAAGVTNEYSDVIGSGVSRIVKTGIHSCGSSPRSATPSSSAIQSVLCSFCGSLRTGTEIVV